MEWEAGCVEILVTALFGFAVLVTALFTVLKITGRVRASLE